MILAIVIYLLGFLTTLGILLWKAIKTYNEDRRLKVSVNEIILSVVACLFSWVGVIAILCMWVDEHGDKIIINLEKKEER